MTIRITSTRDTSSKVKVLCYGEAGLGKTVLASTAPNPLILSAEAGLLSIADKDIPVIEISTVQDIMDAYQFITEAEEAKKFDTICLDSISEIGEVLLHKLKKEEKDARQAYGRLNDDMASLIRQFRDLKDFHVYFSAKQIMREDDYTGISSYRPFLPGKTLLGGLPYFFDEVLAIRIGKLEDGEEYRYLQTQPDIQYTAKDRSDKLLPSEKPDLSYIFKKILHVENIKQKTITLEEPIKQKEESKQEQKKVIKKSDTSN